MPAALTRATPYGLAYVALSSLFIGAWAQFFSQSFYASFPGFGVWVAGDGPFNEHLIRDLGGLNLSLAVLGGLALLKPQLLDSRGLGAAYLVLYIPHLMYHLLHLPHVSAPLDRVTSLSALILSVLVGVLLLQRQQA